MSFTDYVKLPPQNKVPTELAQRSVQLLLIALDYLHQCHIVHTGNFLDISPSNVLQKSGDDSIISQIEKGELEQPIPRRIPSDCTGYESRPLPLSTGLPVPRDLGEARIGARKHRGDITPGIYRAPEVILGMEWDSKVDLWAIGVMMMNSTSRKPVHSRGPLPPAFPTRSEKCYQYWDRPGIAAHATVRSSSAAVTTGNWKGSIPTPDQSFETREQWLDPEDRALFVRFLRRVLCWMPEERPVAEELALAELLTQTPATAARRS
ncbi:protein kinase [Diplocarpon rosae]|nr:protein kinase [Diplocarpon rosae]